MVAPKTALGFYETKPLTFENIKRPLPALAAADVLLSPIVAGICGSDISWYLGHKTPENLKTRLPMALLHEGIAQVVKSGKESGRKPDDIVVVHPLLPGAKIPNRAVGENYLPGGKFMGSNSDGLARKLFVYPASRIVLKPAVVANEIAALTEPLSIAYRTVIDAQIKKDDQAAVIGDGIMGQFIVIMLNWVAKIPQENLYLIGINDEKLNLAKRQAQVINSSQSAGKDKLTALDGKIDVVVEAAGGKAMSDTMPAAVKLARPKGKTIVLGVQDGTVPIPLIDVVNRGLIIQGMVRSRIEDFRAVLKIMKNPKFAILIKRFINKKSFVVKTASDLKLAFDCVASAKLTGRVLVSFESDA